MTAIICGDTLMRVSDASECLPQKGAVDGVVCLLEVYEAHEARNSCPPPNFLQSANHKDHVHGRAIRSKTALLLRSQSVRLSVSAESPGNHFKENLTCVWNERDAAVDSALRLVALFAENGNDRVFSLLWDFPLAPDEGVKPMELQQDGSVLLKSKFQQFRGKAIRPHRSHVFHCLYCCGNFLFPWARSRGHSRLDAAAAFLGCRDRAF